MFEVAASINGVTYSPTSPIATPKSTSSSSSSDDSDGAASLVRVWAAGLAVLSSFMLGAMITI